MIHLSAFDQGLDPRRINTLLQWGSRHYSNAESYIVARQAMTCRLASANQLRLYVRLYGYFGLLLWIVALDCWLGVGYRGNNITDTDKTCNIDT